MKYSIADSNQKYFSFDSFWEIFSKLSSTVLPLELMQSQLQVPYDLYQIHYYCNLLAGPRTWDFEER